jgi:hypothetical protein
MRYLSHGQALDYVSREAGMSRETFDLNIRPRLVERVYSERVTRFSVAAIDRALADPLFREILGAHYDLAAIRDGARHFKRTSGVYFLFLGIELVYVGQSWHVPARLADHLPGVNGDELKTWDAYAVQEHEPELLIELERQFIAAFSPRYNRTRP